MASSDRERLQERVGERFGIVLIFVGIILVVSGLFGLEENSWGNVERDGDDDQYARVAISVILLVFGAFVLAYGGWRYLKFRMSPVYPRYVASTRQHKIARIEAKRHAQVQHMQSAPAQQSQTIVKERETREREIVKVKCGYCGALNDQTAQKCVSCGARM